MPRVQPHLNMHIPRSQSAVTLRRMGTYLEYGRVPEVLLAPLVHALLGAMHIRCRFGSLAVRGMSRNASLVPLVLVLLGAMHIR